MEMGVKYKLHLYSENGKTGFYSIFPIKVKALHSMLLPQSLASLLILHAQCTFSTPLGAIFMKWMIITSADIHSE